MSNNNTPVSKPNARKEGDIGSPLEQRVDAMEKRMDERMDELIHIVSRLHDDRVQQVENTPRPGRPQFYAGLAGEDDDAHAGGINRKLSDVHELGEDDSQEECGDLGAEELEKYLTKEEAALLAARNKTARRASVARADTERKEAVAASAVQRLTFDQKKVEPVRVWFNARKATLTNLTFENYLRWDASRRSYERQYPDEWKNNWSESFSGDIRSALYAFNYTPVENSSSRRTMSSDVKMGIIFMQINNDAMRQGISSKFAPGSEFSYDTELSTLPLEEVVKLVMLAVTPETKAEFREAFKDAMTKKFTIKNKACSLNFHKMQETTMFNIATHYQAYVDFLEEANRIYHKLLELRRQALAHDRRADMPRYDDREGTRDLLKAVCKNAGAGYLIHLMNQIRDSPSDVVVNELVKGRRDELDEKRKRAAKVIARYEDQYDNQQAKPKVQSLAELFDLLRLELDDQRRLSKPVMQRMEELGGGSSNKEETGTLSAMTPRSYHKHADHGGNSDDSDDSSDNQRTVLQAMGKPAYGGRPSATPVDKSKWVCSRALSGLPCPDKDGKLCEGHNNNNPDDKAAYVARQLPIVQEKIRWFKERESALLKSQKAYPSRAGPTPNKHLRAMEFALDPDDEYQHSLLRDAPPHEQELEPDDRPGLDDDQDGEP